MTLRNAARALVRLLTQPIRWPRIAFFRGRRKSARAQQAMSSDFAETRLAARRDDDDVGLTFGARPRGLDVSEEDMETLPAELQDELRSGAAKAATAAAKAERIERAERADRAIDKS